MKKIRRLRVDVPRNSDCGSSPIGDLDFSRWWTDGGRGSFSRGIYLHVPSRTLFPDGGVHRVFCRRSDNPRLEMKAGVLYWLVDQQEGKR
jgi:hypothetical protein